MRLTTILLALSGLAFFSCSKDKGLSAEEQLQEDKKIIQNYVSKKGLVVQSTPSGLSYVITQPGFGPHPTVNDTITFKYKGYLTDDTVFDATVDSQTATFPLGKLVTGLQEGIPLLGKTGKATFLLPSALGYGPDGSAGIPQNSVIIFDIELVSF